MHDTILILKRLFGEEWKNLMLLSLAAAAISLPLVTIGPAVLALHGVLTRLLDGRCAYNRLREFWSVFKAKFRRGLLLEAVAALYLLMVFWCVSIQDAMEDGAVLQIALCVSLFLAMGVGVYWVPLLADTTLPPLLALRNAVGLAVLRLPQTVLAVAAASGFLFLFVLLYPVSVLVYLLLGVGAMAAVSVSLVWPAVNDLLFHGGDTRDEGGPV